MKILMKKVKGPSLVTAVSLKRLQKNNRMNLNYQKENKAKDYVQYGSEEEPSLLVYNPWKILHLKMMHMSLLVASSLNHLYWTMRILLQLLPLISLQKKQNKKNKKKTIRLSAKNCQCWCSIVASWCFHHFLAS
jgi:hypothetical protein